MKEETKKLPCPSQPESVTKTFKNCGGNTTQKDQVLSGTKLFCCNCAGNYIFGADSSDKDFCSKRCRYEHYD